QRRAGGVISTSRIRVMPDFVATHRLTEAASLKMLAAGVAKANELGCKVSLAVVDQSCRLIAFLMMDGARHFSIITTQRQAITSASQRQPTGYAPEENALSMAVRMGDFTNVPGGFPITVAGQVVGAVAAGGAKIEQDVIIAQAALAALEAGEVASRPRGEAISELGWRLAGRVKRSPQPCEQRGSTLDLTAGAHVGDQRAQRVEAHLGDVGVGLGLRVDPFLAVADGGVRHAHPAVEP